MNPPAVVRPGGRWADLRIRIASAAVLAPLALACIWLGGTAFACLLLLITVALAYEWLALCRCGSSMTAILSLGTLPLAVACMAFGLPVAALLFLALGFLAALVTAGKTLACGVPYFGLAAVALVWLRQAPEVGRENVIVLLLLVWASDIGAYLVGRAVGGPKLAPAISPGKTMSGAAGGLAAAVLIGAAMAWGAGSLGSPVRAMVLAGLTGCVAQAGDLFESWLKRRFGVKDSGRLIPGHGGVLDRLDAVLSAAPFAALLALLVGRGVVIWQ